MGLFEVTRYATLEEKFECFRCYISCTKREMKKKGMLVKGSFMELLFRCPNCNQLLHVRSTRFFR